MEGKLKKIGNEYKLYAQDDSCIATSWHSPYQRLSKKNCEAIENGYDLDELAENTYREYPTDLKDSEYHYNRDYQVHKKRKAFIKGFNAAVEILGDKKFSKNKLLVDFVYFLNDRHFNKYMVDTDEVDLYLESLQQTEWDVTFNPNEKDSEECLILKRK